jgi:hypothetical protein
MVAAQCVGRREMMSFNEYCRCCGNEVDLEGYDGNQQWLDDRR